VNNVEQHLRKTLGAGFFTSRGKSHLGFQSVSGGESYGWDGLKRAGDSRRPVWLFQYSLSGWGWFRNAHGLHRVGPGQAFAARIPSAHSYGRDETCPRWTFLWAIVSHPYVVSRLLAHSNLVNEVLSLPAETAAVQGLLALLLDLNDESDRFAEEEGLFRWMLELERWAFSQRHPVEERSRLLGFAEKVVSSHLRGFISVDNLAKGWGTSRSNFTHHFTKVTGRTPADYIREIRLREARKLLRNRRFSVKEVAAQTGFSDANHLCKCFRAYYQISPGAYQRLAGRR